ASAGHVFAAMIAHCLDDGVHAAVANAEAFPGHAAYVRLAARRAVQRDVADDDVLVRDERRAGRRSDDQLAARQALADVVVGVAFEEESHAARHERAEALTRGALEADADRILGQARCAVLARDLAAGDRADDPMHVADRQFGADALAALESRPA